MKIIWAFLGWVDWVTDEYSDTLAIIFITAGGLLSAVGIGGLPSGGTTNGYDFVYIKHPLSLKIGLISVVVGFTLQLYDNLVEVHKWDKTKTLYLTTPVFISLVLLVLVS